MGEILIAALKVATATVASLLVWMVAGKMLALQLGAAGVGLFGILRQLLQYLGVVATLNSQTAMVQGISQRSGDELKRFTNSIFRIQALLGLFVVVLLLLGAPWLGPRLIPHPQATALLRWIALAVLATCANNFFLGLLNGHRKINSLVLSQVLGPVTVLLLALPMIWLLRRGYSIGYVLMLICPAAVGAAFAAYSVRKEGWLPSFLPGAIAKADAVHFFRMSGVLLVSGLLATGTPFLQSHMVAAHLGLQQAGFFWVAWTLSMTYVTLLLGSYGTYYMPSLSRLEDLEDRRSLIRDYLRLSMAAMPILVSIVIVLKPLVISVMFSDALLPAARVMRWMLIGDFFKGISWVLAFPMLAFNKMLWFFWTEALFSITLALASYLWLFAGGSIEGLGAIFLLGYILYLLVMCYYIHREHGYRFRREEMLRFFSGLLTVVLLSAFTWNEVNIRWGSIMAFVLLGSLHLAVMFRGTDARAMVAVLFRARF